MSSSERALKHQGGKGNRITNEQILEELRAFHKHYGNLSSSEYRKFQDKGLANVSIRTIYMRFGSWNDAVKAAGFEPNASTKEYYDPYTKEDCLNAVLKVTELLDGELPSNGDYKNVRICEPDEDLPSEATVRGKFDGSWTKVLKAAEERLNAT